MDNMAIQNIAEGMDPTVGAVGAVASPKMAPDPADVAAFQEMLNNPSSAQAAANAGSLAPATITPEVEVQDLPGPAVVVEDQLPFAATSSGTTPAGTTMGDAILQGLGVIKGNRDKAYQNIIDYGDKMQGEPINENDLVALQYNVFVMSFYQDIASRTADKFNTGIQTLFRGQ